jgi:hypothetical protein
VVHFDPARDSGTGALLIVNGSLTVQVSKADISFGIKTAYDVTWRAVGNG